MSFGRRSSVRFAIPLVAAAAAIAIVWSARPEKLSAGGPVAVPTDIEMSVESFTVEPRGTVDVSSLPPAEPGAFERPHKPFLARNPAALKQWKQELQLELSGAGASIAAPSPALASDELIGFEGMNDAQGCGGCEPPDTYVAVGPNHVFETVNVAGLITDKSGSVIKGPFSLNSLFGLAGNIFVSDPRVKFDEASGRWFVSMISLDASKTNGFWDLAVSTSSDPTGTFNVYSFETSGSLPDFDGLGFNDDKVVQSANAFACGGHCLNPTSFQGNEFIVWDKAALVAGTATSAQLFAPPQSSNTDLTFTIRPATSRTSTTTEFMVSAGSGNPAPLEIWSITGVPPSATVSVSATNINALNSPPNAVQEGTGATIATNDDRLLEAVFRDGQLWASGNSACVPSGDVTTRSCMRFIAIDTSSMTLLQDFDFGTAGFYYYYPAIDLDASDDVVAGFSGSSASQFASVYASSRLAGDPVDTIGPPVLLEAGSTPYNGSPERWGDYSGAAVDPGSGALAGGDATVWVAGEFAESGLAGSRPWSTFIADIQPTSGPTPTMTATGSATRTATRTPTMTATGTRTPTPTFCFFCTRSATRTPTRTATSTSSGTPTRTGTSSRTPTPRPTFSFGFSPTPKSSGSSTRTPTPRPTFSFPFFPTPGGGF